jgi:hypothetical protein
MDEAKLKAFLRAKGHAPGTATAEEKDALGIVDGTCGTHKIMLVATACRKADHDVIIARVGAERDMRIREFGSSNCLDSLQVYLHAHPFSFNTVFLLCIYLNLLCGFWCSLCMQLQYQKLFGHHVGVYVFGDGLTFPGWAQKNYPDEVRNIIHLFYDMQRPFVDLSHFMHHTL